MLHFYAQPNNKFENKNKLIDYSELVQSNVHIDDDLLTTSSELPKKAIDLFLFYWNISTNLHATSLTP